MSKELTTLPLGCVCILDKCDYHFIFSSEINLGLKGRSGQLEITQLFLVPNFLSCLKL
jgi:hypothetical protein